MLRKRILILLGSSFLAASAACADEVGYVDCNSHSDETQVFAKARKSPEVVGTLQCGERFTILVYGFVFSKIQTSDGKIGYVYSSLISADRAATTVQKTTAPRMVASAERVPSPSANGAQPQSAAPQTTMTQASVRTAVPSDKAAVDVQAGAPAASVQAAQAQPPTPSANVVNNSASAGQTAPAAPLAPAQSASTPAATTQPAGLPDASVVTSNISGNNSGTAATVAQPDSAAAAQPQPAAAQPAAPAQPAPAPEAQPAPAPAQPAPAQPAPARTVEPAVQPADPITRWEKPLPSVRQAPLIELFGGYAFSRLNNGTPGYSNYINMNGALGSFGWNWKSWLQITGDTSYNFVTTAGTKYVLYGNHYGARFFRRVHNRWAATPFVEGLVGGSREDSTITGVTYSQNCITYKAGGGVDIHPSRRWEIRLFDFDYYRTAFGTNLHQNNYWVSTGVVLRLFGGRGYE